MGAPHRIISYRSLQRQYKPKSNIARKTIPYLISDCARLLVTASFVCVRVVLKRGRQPMVADCEDGIGALIVSSEKLLFPPLFDGWTKPKRSGIDAYKNLVYASKA